MEEFSLQIQQWLEEGKEVYITGLHGQTLHMMKQSGVFGHLKENGYVWESKSEVLEKVL
jgi:N-dimethylarginine dimethylaminohydrolase